MKHRLSRILAAVFLASALFVPAASPTLANHPNDCVGAVNTTRYGYVLDRTNQQVGFGLKAVRMQTVARALTVCSNPAPGEQGVSYILASIAGTINGQFNFPQLGLCKFANNVNQTFFCFMKPGDDGAPSIVGWFDQDNDGAANEVNGDDYPIAGVTYTFRIELLNTGVTTNHWVWRYYITNTANGVTDYRTEEALGAGTASNYGVTEVWWGCEAGPDNNNVLSTLDSSARILNFNLGYRTTQGGTSAWSYTQSNASDFVRPPLWGLGGNPAYYDLNHDRLGPNSTDRFWCTTNASH